MLLISSIYFKTAPKNSFNYMKHIIAHFPDHLTPRASIKLKASRAIGAGNQFHSLPSICSTGSKDKALSPHYHE